MKKLKVAFQIDEIEKLYFETDTSVAFMEEAFARNFEISYYYPKSLYGLNGEVYAAEIFELNSPIPTPSKDPISRNKSLQDFDVIFIRNDPPYDMQYLTLAHLLRNLEKDVFFVNSPTSLITHPEKIFPFSSFAKYMPETLITRDGKLIREFRQKHPKMVAKPLYAAGGKDVFLITENDPNSLPIIENLIEKHDQPIILQKFIEEIYEIGDKRVLIAADEIIGIIARFPIKGGVRANLASGGSFEATSLTEKQKMICEDVIREIKDSGIFFAGLDLIGENLTEINITSPTGLRSFNQLKGDPLFSQRRIWDLIIEKLNSISKF